MRISDWSSDVCSSDLVLAEPFRGRLGAALLHADDVVDAVAHQRQQVDDLVGAHAELRHDRLVRIHAAAAHGVDQRHAAAIARAAHQLGEVLVAGGNGHFHRSAEHTSELQSLMRISYAVFCLKTKNTLYYLSSS